MESRDLVSTTRLVAPRSSERGCTLRETHAYQDGQFLDEMLSGHGWDREAQITQSLTPPHVINRSDRVSQKTTSPGQPNNRKAQTQSLLVALLPFGKSAIASTNGCTRIKNKTTKTVPFEVSHRLMRVCSSKGIGSFEFLLTAWHTILFRYSEREHLDVLARDETRHAAVTGIESVHCAPLVYLQLEKDTEAGFDTLVAATKCAHDKASSDHRGALCGSPPHTDTEESTIDSLMPVYFGYRFENYASVRLPYVGSEPCMFMSKTGPLVCELGLEVIQSDASGLKFCLEYCSVFYDAEDMNRFLENFLAFVSSATTEFTQPACDLAMCGETELRQLRQRFWAMEATDNLWGPHLVLERFLSVADSNPNATALKTSNGDAWTYGHLLLRAQQISSVLEQRGITPGQLIGILCDPGAECIAGLLGILLSRCGYVPMDPGSPVERLAFMAYDSRIETIVIGGGFIPVAKAITANVNLSIDLIPIETTYSAANCQRATRLPLLADPFYAIYTSGTTGKPKGFVVKHSNVHQLLSSFCHDFNLSARDRFLHQTSLCFDTSILQIFPALAIGATVYIATKDTRKDPSELAAFLHQSSITVTYFTPTHFSLLLDTSTETLRKCSSYRWAFFGGERVPPQLIKAFYELRTPATAYNGWGPSELTVHCTMQKISESELETSSIPIGSPLANCHVYIVDSKLNPLPVGVSGEICVAGAHTVSGYINRVEESGRRFPINPYASHSDKSRGWLTLHRSGDRGRFLNSGYIEFQGRLSGDKQVKLRGFRIDLGEIEQSLLDASDNGNGQDIAAVSVVARDLTHHTPDLMDDRQIIAFFVPARPTNAETLHNFVNELQNKIKNRLNGYMLPNGYQVLDKMPVTIGGKLDQQNLQRRALNLIFPSTRQHTPSTTLQMQISANDTHPSPEVLAEIVSLFKDVLALPEDRIIHGATNFFDVGGQSIRLVRLQAKIKTATKVKVPLPILFQNPTPFAIARWVCSELRSLAGNARTGQVLNKFLDWTTETTLPNDPRYTVSTEIGSRPRSEVSNILVTGPESFVGIHLLATLLTTRLATKIYVLGSLGSIGIAELENLFKQYRLLDHTWTTSVLATRLRTFTGSLAKPHFGLDPRQFTDLGVQLHAIYHMGTEVSILKTYTDLKNVNIRGTLDIIELASHGLELTEIHYVSTQSVSHLQTWETTHRNTGSIVTHEETVERFTPPATDEHGYFKARWAVEMLMTKAAQRGFAISIYRFSAATASRLTGVPNPATDLVPLMIKMMLEHRCIPDFVGKELPFMIDFIPVDHLVSAFYHLSTHGLPVDFRPSGWNTASPTIHHICNPNPLPLTDLLTKMNLVSNESDVQYRVVPAGQWVEAVKSGRQSPVEELRLNALKTYLDLGHIMFALDTTRTKETLRKIGCDAVDTCPPVDVEYLRQMTGDNA